MGFFPTIKFVDRVDEVDDIHQFAFCCWAGRCKLVTKQIYVRRGKHQTLVLMHELCHWFFGIFTQNGHHPIHKWLDRHFIVKSWKPRRV